MGQPNDIVELSELHIRNFRLQENRRNLICHIGVESGDLSRCQFFTQYGEVVHFIIPKKPWNVSLRPNGNFAWTVGHVRVNTLRHSGDIGHQDAIDIKVFSIAGIHPSTAIISSDKTFMSMASWCPMSP